MNHKTELLTPIPVYLGYDHQETVAYHVASHSLLRYSSRPLSITPVALPQLAAVFDRQRDPKQSTDFSFSRFLVPFLNGYKGWAIFTDCDILALDDIAKLWQLRDDRYAVMVVKHDYKPKEATKFLGQVQTQYEKKNWSSVMLLNTERCQALTPGYVNSASGLELHRFHWLESEDLIGELPRRWNHLVDYDPALSSEELSILHFTSGGPWFDDCRDCGYANLWKEECDQMMNPLNASKAKSL